MKSVRLDKTLEARLKEAAQVSGEPMSEIIRQAIEERCTHILGERLAPRLADVIGVVHSQGGQAHCTGKAFVENLRTQKKADQ